MQVNFRRNNSDRDKKDNETLRDVLEMSRIFTSDVVPTDESHSALNPLGHIFGDISSLFFLLPFLFEGKQGIAGFKKRSLNGNRRLSLWYSTREQVLHQK